MQALLIPLIAPTNCQYTSGLYGLPKFKQLVTALGIPPLQTIFLAASLTAIAQPISGSALTTNPTTGDPFGFVARNSEKVTSTHYFVRVKNAEYNFSNNPSYVTGSVGQLAQTTFVNDPKTYITTVGLYNDNHELLAVAKLSKPLLKSFQRESLIRVKLDF